MLENNLFSYSHWDLCDEDLPENIDLTKEEADIFFYNAIFKQPIGQFNVGESLHGVSINLTKFTITLYTYGGWWKTYNLNINVEP
jgi:hypothetical protein